MSRRVVWLQLLIGWLPVWGLFSMLILVAHRGSTVGFAIGIAFRSILSAALLSILVQRGVERFKWPRPVPAGFVALHLLFANAFSFGWLGLNSLVETILRGRLFVAIGPGWGPTLLLGAWLYVMIAGVSYTAQSTERAARAEASAARSQLAALRSQLHPHFLFNALHTVVQLIPREPQRAAQAAERLGDLLRATIEDDRDLVSLGEEWALVERYLELERMRFGDRLRVQLAMTDEARAATVPLFALQTLVENAVRHGAAPNVAPTDISISAKTADGRVTLIVKDSGAGSTSEQMRVSGGTGLQRLRERLEALYGGNAELVIDSGPGRGFSASLILPAAAPGE